MTSPRIARVLQVHGMAACITKVSYEAAQPVPVEPPRLLQVPRRLLESEHHVWPPRGDILHLANDLPVDGVQLSPDILLIVLCLRLVLDARRRRTSSAADMQTCLFRNGTDAPDIPFLRHLHEPGFGAPESRAQVDRRLRESSAPAAPASWQCAFPAPRRASPPPLADRWPSGRPRAPP